MQHDDKNYMLGISGKRGAGKDTFAQLIHFCDLKRTYPGIWSDRTFDFFQDGNTHSWGSDWTTRFFAKKLKEMAAALTGHADQYSQAGKTTFLPEWGMTVGEIQQKLGTDAIRNGLHDQAWILACFADIEDGENTMVTDMRFPNEMGAVKKKGGITIRIDGDPKKQQGDGTRDDSHPSETSLDNADFDIRIINDGTIEDLEAKAMILLDLLPHYSRDVFPETVVL